MEKQSEEMVIKLANQLAGKQQTISLQFLSDNLLQIPAQLQPTFLQVITHYHYIPQSTWLSVFESFANLRQSKKAIRCCFSQGYFASVLKEIQKKSPQFAKRIKSVFGAGEDALGELSSKGSQIIDKGQVRQQIESCQKQLQNKTLSLKLIGLLEGTKLQKWSLMRHLHLHEDSLALQRLALVYPQEKDFICVKVAKIQVPKLKERIYFILLSFKIQRLNLYLRHNINQQFWTDFLQIVAQVRNYFSQFLQSLPNSRKIVYLWADFETYVTKDKTALQQLMDHFIHKASVNYYDFKKYVTCAKSLGLVKQCKQIFKKARGFGQGFQSDWLQFNCIFSSFQQFKDSYTELISSFLANQEAPDQPSRNKDDKKKNLHTVFINSFPFAWTQQDIKAFIPPQLSFVNLRLISKQGKKYCYIDFSSQSDAKKFVLLNGKNIQQKPVYIALSKPPEEKIRPALLLKTSELNQNAILQQLRQLAQIQEWRELRDKKGNLNGTIVLYSSEAELKKIQNSQIVVGQLKRLQSEQERTLFIKNLHYDSRLDTLQHFFQNELVQKINMPFDKQGKSKGYASVTFYCSLTCQKYIKRKSAMVGGRRAQFYSSRGRERPSKEREGNSKQRKNDDFAKYL